MAHRPLVWVRHAWGAPRVWVRKACLPSHSSLRVLVAGSCPTSNPTQMLVLSMLLNMIEQSMKSLLENEEAALAAIRYHSNQLHFSCIGETLHASVVVHYVTKLHFS